MNKKFLSAILFGALMVTSTGTFVSCKDYDDDVKDLQEQINKLATKEDMQAQINTLQTALTAAAKDASDAITKATAAETAAKTAGDAAAAAKAAADKAVAEAKAESIKAVQAELAALKKEVTESTEAALAEMRKEVNAATKKVEDIVGKIADMVTSIELVKSYTDGSFDASAVTLGLATAVVEKDFTFSKDITGAISFKAGEQKQTTDEFVVRVSPTNAVLDPSMISLVDSKGRNLNEFMTVSKVERFEGLLSRAASETGLWTVTVELKKYEKESFNAATLADPTKAAAAGNYILFAAQANNTLSTAATRYVTSSFDLTIEKEDYTPAGVLNFFVDKANVTTINNRVIGKTGESLTASDAITYAEQKWRNDVAKAEVKDEFINKGTATTPVDDRSTQKVHLAVQGKDIKIELAKVGVTTYDDIANPSEIRAMYVVLDKQNAVQSLNSEINAWNSYDFEGLNEIVEGTSATIAVDAKFVINDIVGFRVYAVNQDGKLVDPDGRAFYVQIGSEATDWNAVNTVITPDADDATAATAEKSAKENVSLSKLTGAATFAWEADKIGDVPAFKVVLVKKNNGEVEVTNGAIPSGLKFEDIAQIYTMPTVADWTKYEDDKVYNGTLTVKDATGFALSTLKVTMKKVLPTVLPAGFTFKDKQVIDGIYNCYLLASDDLLADSWVATTATKGRMPIENFINFGKGKPAQYKVVLAESMKDNEGKLKEITVNGNGQIEVAAAFIDNTKEHATTISYDYGQISSKKNADGTSVNVKVTAAEIKTVYNCFYKKDVHTWSWATRAQLGGDYNTLITPTKPADGYKKNPLSTELTYGQADTESYEGFIFGKNAIDGEFSKLLNAVYEGSLIIKEAALTSDATQKEDYFDVTTDLKFTAIKTDLGSNPKADVPSTLTIKCKDSYNHDVVITLKMTVKPRQ